MYGAALCIPWPAKPAGSGRRREKAVRVFLERSVRPADLSESASEGRSEPARSQTRTEARIVARTLSMGAALLG